MNSDAEGIGWRSEIIDQQSGLTVHIESVVDFAKRSEGGWSRRPSRESSSRYHYSYEFSLENGADPVDAAAALVGGCGDVFPISGCSSGFAEGDHLKLQQRVGPYTQSFPVDVALVAETEVRFVSTGGHPEGVGRWISFQFLAGADDTTLRVQVWGPGSPLTQVPLVSDLNNLFARRTWAQLASNLDAAAAEG